MAVKEKLSFRLKDSLLDKTRYSRTIKTITYITLFFVGVFMTVLNVINFGLTDLLTVTTGVFSILIVPNFLVTLFFDKGTKVTDVLFAIELLAMFLMFIYFGKPQGFSALWIALLPISSMIFYGRLWGSILSGIMFIFLVALFWTPFGELIKMYNGYNETFKIRFPILYFAFYLVAFFLETLQNLQFNALEKVSKINENYSTHDQLTGLYNRKGLYDQMEICTQQYTYDKIGIIIFDLDDFKKVNDTYGHVAGDEVLKYFSKLITQILSKGIGCRWGGEEFLVGYLNESISKNDLERIRKTFENHIFDFNNSKVSITVSCGVYETNDKDAKNRLSWINKADQALYKAKTTGKNKVVYY